MRASLFFLIWVLGIIGFIFVIIIGLYLRSPSRVRLRRDERRNLADLENLVDTIREACYNQRELESDSPLATIILDEIRAVERKHRKALD